MRRIGWIGAGEHAPSTNDGQNEDAVIDLDIISIQSFAKVEGPGGFSTDVVERMDEDAIAFLEARSFQARNERTNPCASLVA